MSCLPGTNLIAWVNWKCDSRRSVTEIYGFVFTTTQYILFCKEFPSVLFINFSSIHTFFSFFVQRMYILQQVKILSREVILWVLSTCFPSLVSWALSLEPGIHSGRRELTLERCRLTSNTFAVASVCPRTWFSLIWSSSFFLLQLLYLF